MKILIVDDDERQRESLSDLIESFGYDVGSAANIGQARERLINDGPFHLIMLDYMFGPTEQTGLEGISTLKTSGGEDMPIILITGYATLDAAVDAIRKDLADFLLKPVDPTYLKHTISKNLEEARLVSENKRLLSELKIKNEALSRLNDFKSKFLSFCAHDLANTLSSSMVAADLLNSIFNKEKTDKQASRVFQLLLDSLNQTQRLVSDLVDWSSIEKGKFKVDSNPVDVKDFLGLPVFTYLKERAKSKKVLITMPELKDKDLGLRMDSKRILQVVANLLENALRYTPENGTITFSISHDKDDNSVIFSVKDSGAGIEPNELSHIFESFYQGKGGKGKGRLGLGLSIAKEIVESHNGKIWVDSAGHDQGTSFSFKLPQ
ncbi:ATP-binding protein [Elusimicrobiota bacterium]